MPEGCPTQFPFTYHNLVVHGYCTKLSQTLTVCTSIESAFIRRLSDMGNGYWWNLRSLKVVL
ncbi:hypothetical protein RO3G_17354 [Rhizopus delemar RA 99-880]|uniref:Uncharacterized protein n=1 Tax=Rhizopus delemar (strain RA 99-880 / ATCC MYA-4621 / FGSC 9543 / NRRL 43880) TaxID=246409 RepID=I1CW13_RHIO9|nr:hypothetical protein RO3G_17354 [Rhizopus delemar RA 99-880]|eukprot:EIE92643.1 hypothetical protein RO3G_17354 [Rhizopus delemar RA 99-880]